MSSSEIIGTELDLIDRLSREIAPADADLEDWFRLYARAHRRRLAEDLLLVRSRANRRSRILEVGSVPLLLTAALASEKFDVTGVDIDPSRFAAEIQRRRLRIVRCDIETGPLPFPDGTFDCVLFNELFEHLRFNPPKTMSEIHRVARPGGTLMLSTPNLYSFRGMVNFLLKQRTWAVGADPLTEFKKLDELGHMGHVREYTLREVKELLTGCGFEIEDVIHRGTPQSRIERAVTWLRAPLLPVVSVIARRS